MTFCSSCAPDAGDGPERPNFQICIDCQNRKVLQQVSMSLGKRQDLQPFDAPQAKPHREILHGHSERYFLESLSWIPCTEASKIRNIDGLPSWSWKSRDGPVDWLGFCTPGHGTFLTAASACQGNIVKFFYSDPDKGMRKVNEDVRTFSELRDDLQRGALHLLLNTAPTWWPQSAQNIKRPNDIDADTLKSLVPAVYENAKAKGWPYGLTFGLMEPNKKGRVKALSEAGFAKVALDSLVVSSKSASWWPAKVDSPEVSDRPDEKYNGEGSSEIPYKTALQHPSSLLFNTTCAYLSIETSSYQATRTPRGGYLVNFKIITPETGFMIGITISMSPKYTDNTFPDPDHTRTKVYPVFVIGACTAARVADTNLGRQGPMWDELCLQVMIAEEDRERGVMKRLALGVVYPDIWEALNPDWKSIVLV